LAGGVRRRRAAFRDEAIDTGLQLRERHRAEGEDGVVEEGILLGLVVEKG